MSQNELFRGQPFARIQFVVQAYLRSPSCPPNYSPLHQMLRWIDVLKFAVNGNPEPDRKVAKTEEEWQALLTEEQFRVTRLRGTERPFSSEMCELFKPGKYKCICCGTQLFDSGEKFDSGTGWPSFTQPIKENAVAYHKDESNGRSRIETVCNTCRAHLGHVFPDGPEPSKLRFCINAVALEKVESTEAKITFGGGCFWCTEAIFQRIKGVISVQSGYSGGDVVNPTYREVCSGRTGHAEVIEVTYDPDAVTYEDIIRVHLGTHDPTTLNRQGGDQGTQYRSVIFYRNDEEKQTALDLTKEYEAALGQPIVTQITPFVAFFPAEAEHQNYFNNNADQNSYCGVVIEPKLAKFRAAFPQFLSE